ncbi:hybrid sensor histidine kinase/response regulator [Sphaerotilus uruguayifluvii]|uniref:histidine kinase n=1 Tax=Sphaerotilus uruguayifluvii TaxID=2735897 RepID=A0ABX2G331_9BURK|nr:ATP-binding protein [Leptothrix sp. C29]NRT55839.1 signal transduction histidine kinase/CheY-like chemotaxis protein/purine-cytosine permease-like protein [Leptothrix sp. C29]
MSEDGDPSAAGLQAEIGPARGLGPAGEAGEPVQRVIKIRRDYNDWVASETLEDYALRFAPRSARRWSIGRVAVTALGGAASFLVLEAVGATLLVQHGFVNAALAILATGLIIFLAGLPISAYAARHGVDMDLLTRGAGFGYIGSTLTSLIYASFTFIFFALEAAVMAYALELAFDIPPAWGYLVCAAVVLPLVTHGVTMISRLQVWTQPLWALMLVLPYAFVLHENPGVLDALRSYGGESDLTGFDPHAFGAAMTVGIALFTQMGEQADYLRFMPERTRENRLRWWAGVVTGGPGWVVFGVLKMLGGALLASLAIGHMVPIERAVDPNQMYLAAYEYVFPHYGWAIAATALFVVISQLKINVTNAYAGSLAWSNFFSRITHSHPGRVVWVVFNTGIALMLMEMEVFQALGGVLSLYSNIAISWMMAVVADLVVNKPLGLSPKGIEFRRAHLYDINPVGVGAMGAASLVSVAAYLGIFGAMAQAWSAPIALVTALLVSPLLAWATRGRFYLAPRVGEGTGVYRRYASPQRCTVCEREYEGEDMTHCPAYRGAICSLCCTLDVRCHDLCKPPQAHLSAQWVAVLRRLLPRPVWPSLERGLGHYLLMMAGLLPLLALLAGMRRELVLPTLALVSGVVAWWLVLAHKSRQVAQEEANRQTQALHAQTQALRREIESHRQTDLALQQAKQAAESANLAKSRYITTISHELRTPLNSILGYAQLLEEDETMPPQRRQAVSVIRRGGDHLLSLIEGTLDLARIESGRLRLDVRPMRFAETLGEITRLLELQAAAKGLVFRSEIAGAPACVRADDKRLRQILINIVGNAIKFTREGEVVLRLQYAREIARFEIADTGPGMTAEEMARIFEPFERGSAAAGGSVSGGAGLGLTISRMLADLMGGELTVDSQPGRGTTFRLRLFLPEVHDGAAGRPAPVRRRIGVAGPPRCIWVVDNEEVDRGLIVSLLQPLGFTIRQAASGEECLRALQEAGGALPDAIFMDLAMPGIDGWETLRRIRAQGLLLAGTPAAIVSANAFDKGLDNDVGIEPGDFLVKPVRVSELLDWLGRRLALQWIEAEAPAAEPALSAPGAPARPPAPEVPLRIDPERLRALRDAIGIGHVRGVMRELDRIEAAQPECAALVGRLRALARQFQLDAMNGLLRRTLDENDPRDGHDDTDERSR